MLERVKGPLQATRARELERSWEWSACFHWWSLKHETRQNKYAVNSGPKNFQSVHELLIVCQIWPKRTGHCFEEGYGCLCQKLGGINWGPCLTGMQMPSALFAPDFSVLTPHIARKHCIPEDTIHLEDTVRRFIVRCGKCNKTFESNAEIWSVDFEVAW